jgi:hypothetical protein
MIGNAGEHAGEIVLRVEAVELGALDHINEGFRAAGRGPKNSMG